MNDNKFDPKKMLKLNNPQRLIDIPPEYIRQKLDIIDSNVFAEIGAGTGFFSIAFLKQFNPLKIYAFDISDLLVNWMNDHVAPLHPEIIPVKSRENAVPMGDHAADLVFMITLHHELDDPELMLNEAYRILKPGGKILIIDWKKEEMEQGPPAAIRCLPEQVREQLDNAGFQNIHIFGELPKHFLITAQKAG